jgi:predicted Zn finger-like uncharacterized protein
LRIQCERCETVYELDDARVPAGGAAVQCTRCGHVFRAARGPSDAERTLVGYPAPPAPGPEPAGAGDASRTAVFASTERRLPGGASRMPPAAGAPAAGAPDAGRSRTGPIEDAGRTAISFPAAPAAEPSDAGSVAEASGASGRRRAGRRWPWLLLVIALLVAILLLGGCSLFRSRIDPRASALREQAHATMAHDDRADLERAAGQLGAAATLEPGWAAPRADRALVLLLQADDLADAARPLEQAVRTADAERGRLEVERPSDWQAHRDAAAERSRAAARGAGELRDQARALTAEARAILEPLAADRADEPEVARALSLLHGLGGDVARAAQLAPRGSGGSPPDPWGTIAVATATLRRRDEAAAPAAGSAGSSIPALDALVSRSPELLRARVVLARSLAASDRRDDAVAALDTVLLANPEHERARALKAEILSPPPVAMSPVPVPKVAPPPQRAGHLPRLRSSDAGKSRGARGDAARTASGAAQAPAAKATD